MQSPVVSDYYGWRSTRLVYVHALRASQYMYNYWTVTCAVYIQVTKKVFLNESSCRLKKPTKLDGNDTKTLSHRSYVPLLRTSNTNKGTDLCFTSIIEACPRPHLRHGAKTTKWMWLWAFVLAYATAVCSGQNPQCLYSSNSRWCAWSISASTQMTVGCSIG